MKKQMKKTLALALVLCLLVSAVPVAAVSAVDSPAAVPEVPAEPEQSVSVEETTTPETTEEVTVLYEDESLRGEYEKHFLMSDGSYQAVVYGYPVHELVDGVWVEIESTNQNARGDVSPDSARSNILDNYVWEGHGVQNSDSVRLYIGNKSGYECQAYIQFATMPTIPAGATITTATMTVNIVSGTSTANNAKAFQVTGGEWTSSTLQWSNKPVANISLEENISHNNKTKYQFSCLAAVQHWYDGDTTGQNENYGIMLCYQDPKIADYNSFYSADCTDATMRPALTISYDPHKITINEGETYNLSVSRLTDSVTWSSSNAVIASVSTTGVVSGNRAGCATITASVNGSVVKEYLVYVKIYEGTFYIRNKPTGYYLSAKYKNFGAGTGLVQSAKVTSISDAHWQIWRISYLADGCYALRAMHKPNMGLKYTNDVKLQDIGTSYSMSAIGENALWTISYSNGGYEIKNCGEQNYSLYSVDSQCDSAVSASNSSSSLHYRWLFEPVTVETDLVLYALDTERAVSMPRRGVAPGQSRILEDINLAFAVTSSATISQTVYWTSSAENVAMVDSTTGMVTGVSKGETTIQGTAWGNGSPYRETYTLVVSEIPISGSELPYEPNVWNDDLVKRSTNCYSYAFNNQWYPMNPGSSSYVGSIIQKDITAQNVFTYVTQDSYELEFVFEEIGWEDCCDTGSYKVALVVDEGVDYHWYRQNPDGTWSHKPGNTEVRNYDASGMIIYNPETADRNYPYADYDEFVGFFRVTPLNYINNTGLAYIGQQSALETSSLAFELEKAELPDSSKASSVRIGMSYEEVTAILGKPQRQVTFGVMVVEYALSNGERFFVEYTQIGSVYEVCSYRLEA